MTDNTLSDSADKVELVMDVSNASVMAWCNGTPLSINMSSNVEDGAYWEMVGIRGNLFARPVMLKYSVSSYVDEVQ